ncbi:hypothetical protein GGF46_001725 [Coemansia sp. RSA 552]|nr:hypothetical protein GGF46_001725 [Coemansia sp. RSA 552]
MLAGSSVRFMFGDMITGKVVDDVEYAQDIAQFMDSTFNYNGTLHISIKDYKFYFPWTKDYEYVFPILHRNAETLTRVAILYKDFKGFDRLYTDVDDYPAPFPRLEQLEIDFEYPFGDDLPFQGNTKSLRSLSLEMGDKSIMLLVKLGVFVPGRLQSLEKLVIDVLQKCPELEHLGCVMNQVDGELKGMDIKGMMAMLDPPSISRCSQLQVLDLLPDDRPGIATAPTAFLLLARMHPKLQTIKLPYSELKKATYVCDGANSLVQTEDGNEAAPSSIRFSLLCDDGRYVLGVKRSSR